MALAGSLRVVAQPGGRRWPSWSLSPILIAAPLLAGSALLPADWRTIAALLAIIVLGVPHGALDGEIARDVFRPRFGRLWFPIFSAPYLTLSALVLVAWHLAPLWTLAGFLLASVWHFGAEEAEGTSPLEQVVRGGLPIAVPTLVHPLATADIFSTVTERLFVMPPGWLQAGSYLWLALALVWAMGHVLGRRTASLAVPGLLAAGFVVLPPLTAFAIYFVCVHAPAHTEALIKDRARGRRVHDARSAVLLSVPLSVMTVVLGAALWPLYGGPIPAHLLALTLQGLAALTLPHMLLEGALPWIIRRRPGNLALSACGVGPLD